MNATTLVQALGRPALLVGPSLGTTAETLWRRCAEQLGGRFHVIGWDLPGHGGSPVAEPFEIAGLARAVLDLVDGPFYYAGDSVGGAVGLQILLDAPDRVTGAALICTGAKIGAAGDWRARAATVRASGTAAMVDTAAQRWFAPGFLGREPTVASALLLALHETDAEGYAQTCEALATFDVRDRLGEISVPVLAVAGAHDGPTPPDTVAQIAHGVRNGRLVVLDDVAHLAPAEDPAAVAALIIEEFA